MLWMVVATEIECPDNGPGEEPGDAQSVVRRVDMCGSTETVGMAIALAHENDEEWAVFELTGEWSLKAVRCSVVFDGSFRKVKSIARAGDPHP